MNDPNLEVLSVGNALQQVRVRAAIAQRLSNPPRWSQVFSRIDTEFAALIEALLGETSDPAVRLRIGRGFTPTEEADLDAIVASALGRGDKAIAGIFVEPLVALAKLLDALRSRLDAAFLQQADAAVAAAHEAIAETLAPKEGMDNGIADLGEIKVRSRLPPSRSFDVWFGTNRKPVFEAAEVIGYSAERDTVTHVGRCTVEIPDSHRIGSSGSVWWRRLLHGDDRLSLKEVVSTERDAFWHEIREKLAAVDAGSADAIVFLHGYNVSFEEAAISAAQIGADLSLPGLMAFFSWPSRGKLFDYPADEATIEASEQAIVAFLDDFRALSGARAVHLIAHSMGNRGLLRAVQRSASKAARENPPPFGQIILAAPDVDSDLFRQLAGAYPRVSERTTLYVSAGDRAVLGSRILHSAHRAGFAPPVCTVPGIDTINVTKVDLSQLGHGYVASSRVVLTDMFEILTKGTSPDRRGTLRQVVQQSIQYWEFAS